MPEFGQGPARARLRSRATLPGDEAEPDAALIVLLVSVDQRQALPGTQLGGSAQDRHGHRATQHGGQQVISPVARAPVLVTVLGLAGQNLLQPGQEICVTARAQLDYNQCCRGVGHEGLHQAVALGGAEASQLGREIDDRRAGGVDPEFL